MRQSGATLWKYLISEVELFPREEQKTQKRFVKAIAYKFPIEQRCSRNLTNAGICRDGMFAGEMILEDMKAR